MSRALRLTLVGLVLANLGFVYITEAARWSWLGPLVGLTLVSPLLMRLHGRLWRGAWNIAVLAVTAQLVRHVVNDGVAHLLEDGLLLAALCQVHLVNNLSGIQKPDLLFFNSFLIAVVTSYLSFDVGYCAVFVVYAPLLVFALQLRAAERLPVRRVFLSSLWRSAAVLGVTLLAFFFWPRDFHRPGLLGERFRLTPGNMSRVDFSDEVSLTPTGHTISSDRVVFRATLRHGSPAAVPAHWRGAALDRFDGQDWRAGFAVVVDRPWMRDRSGRWRRPADTPEVTLDVEYTSAGGTRVFAPLAATRAQLHPSSGPRWIEARPDLTLRCPPPEPDSPPLRYSLAVATKKPGAAIMRARAGFDPRHLWLVPRTVPPLARQLAKEVRARFPDDAPQHTVVEEMRRTVAGRYEYLGAGEEGGAESLEQFVNGGAGGHCEYFATTLAIMLRCERIPARLVTGYRSQEWDEDGRVLTVRARHAHAWVEVLDPRAGWYTVDATPAVEAPVASAGGRLFARVRLFFSGLWEWVAGFNQTGRSRVVAWFRSLPRRESAPAIAGSLLVLLAALVLRRRRSRGPAAVRAYVRSVARCGLAAETGETPRELLARARAADLKPDRLRDLQRATETHEQQRYAGAR